MLCASGLSTAPFCHLHPSTLPSLHYTLFFHLPSVHCLHVLFPLPDLFRPLIYHLPCSASVASLSSLLIQLCSRCIFYVGFLREAESHSWDACYIWSTFQSVCREVRCGAPHHWRCRDQPGAERDTAMPQPKIILTQLWLSLAAARLLANQISKGKAPTLATDASPLS